MPVGRAGVRVADVVFIVDDLGAWLVGLLADAGLKKLTTLMLGSEQDRALRRAASEAVQQTVDELVPAGGKQADRLALAIRNSFRKPMPKTLLAGKATLLEALQVGIADQLAVEGNVALTGVGTSPDQVLTVPVAVLAEKLGGYLVREIVIRGSRGGPLTPLANQLDHDQQHLQGQRLEGMIARLANAVRAGRDLAVLGQALRLLPRPAPYGREELLADLDVCLTEGDADRPHVVTLFGLGGTGKTSVALEYTYRDLDTLKVAWQLAADDSTVLTAGFGDLAAQLGLRAPLPAGDPVAHVHDVLAARPGDWLLIFDNAPALAMLRHTLPPKGRGRVLITSQNPFWPGGQALEVPKLGQDVAAAFLQARTHSADQDAALQLAGELDGLPLALDQATAYMQATGHSIREYLGLFRQRRAELLARGEPTGYDKRVSTTWALAFAELDHAGRAAGLLRLAACYAAEDIPLRLLLLPRPGLTAEFGAEVAPLLLPLLEDDLARDDAIADLRRYSLISAPHDGLVSVNRLVQAITLAQLPADVADAWRQAAAMLIDAALPGDPTRQEDWPVFAALLPHAQAALTHASQGLAKIAEYLGASGNYAAARDLAQQIVRALETELGAERRDTLIARGGLAFWTGQAGDPAEARDQFAELLRTATHVMGGEDHETLTIRANLARWTGAAGDPAAARDQFAELLPVRERLSGFEDPSTLTARANLAHYTGEAGDPAAARDQFAELLPVRTRISGPDHPETLAGRSNLARWTGEAGDPAGAAISTPRWYLHGSVRLARSTPPLSTPSTTWPAGPGRPGIPRGPAISTPRWCLSGYGCPALSIPALSRRATASHTGPGRPSKRVSTKVEYKLAIRSR